VELVQARAKRVEWEALRQVKQRIDAHEKRIDLEALVQLERRLADEQQRVVQNDLGVLLAALVEGLVRQRRDDQVGSAQLEVQSDQPQVLLERVLRVIDVILDLARIGMAAPPLEDVGCACAADREDARQPFGVASPDALGERGGFRITHALCSPRGCCAGCRPARQHPPAWRCSHRTRRA